MMGKHAMDTGEPRGCWREGKRNRHPGIRAVGEKTARKRGTTAAVTKSASDLLVIFLATHRRSRVKEKGGKRAERRKEGKGHFPTEIQLR